MTNVTVDPVVRAVEVDHYYGHGSMREQALFNVTAEIRRGEIVMLLGPSGSGKTTLLTLIGALRSTRQGSLRVLDHELRDASRRTLCRLRRRMGYVFQSHNLLDALTVNENVQMPLFLGSKMSRRTAADRSSAMLDAVGLDRQSDRYPRELSGGQRQRVAIARALVNDPEILLADEPTGGLDGQGGHAIAELMRDLARRRGCTMLIVTHDTRIFDIADRVLGLEDGRLEGRRVSLPAGRAAS